jgi:hypothetical protein
MEKSPTRMTSVVETDCIPLAPTTLKLKVSVPRPESPLTVSVLLPPGAMTLGLKKQAAGLFPEQARVIFPENPY